MRQGLVLLLERREETRQCSRHDEVNGDDFVALSPLIR